MARINFALASNGSTASATSQYNEGSYSGAPANAIDGNRLFPGSAWNGVGSIGGIFHSLGAPATFEVNFNQNRTFDEINVFTPRDSFTDKSELTLVETFTQYGIIDFTIDYWNGTEWIEIEDVEGNNKVWRQFTFSPVTGSKVRLVCTAAGNTHTRIMEFEAIGDGPPPPTDETTVKLFVGTSRTEGVKATSPSNSTDAPPHQYAVKRGLSLVNSFKFDNPGNDNVTPSGYLVNANDAGKFVTVKNYGIGFLKLQDLIDNFATLVVTPTNGFDNKIAIIEIGCNDTVDKTAAYIFGKWQEIGALCSAAGITSYIKTIGAIGQDPAYNVVAQAANAMLRADHSAFDFLIDDARNTVFADGYDSTYMEPDGAHWKNNANEKNAEITKRAIDGTLVFPVITTNSLPNATENTLYNQTLAATNSPTTWQKKSGTLPSGITFDAANHKFTGTPTQTGTFNNIVIWAIDAFGNFDERIYSLTVNEPAEAYTVLPSDLTENAFSENKGNYYYSSPLARLTILTDATELTVGMWTSIYTFNPNAAKCVIKVDGEYLTMANCAANGFNEDVIELPEGEKSVEITVGAQAKPGGAIIGTFLKTIALNSDYEIVPATTTGKKILGFGDSIIVGGDLTYGLRDGWVSEYRNLNPTTSFTVIGFGYASLKHFAEQPGGLAALVEVVETVNPDIFLDTIGTNDFGLQQCSSTEFGTLKASLMDLIHAALPNTKYWMATLLPRTDEAEKHAGFGNFPAYRTAQAAAADARPSFVKKIDVSNAVSPENFADGLHPNQAGHIEYAEFWDAMLVLIAFIQIAFTLPPLVSHIRLKRTASGEADLIRVIDRTNEFQDEENLTDGKTYFYSAQVRKPWTDWSDDSEVIEVSYNE